MDTAIDILGIGNAIIDVVAPVPAELLVDQGLVPGSMTLVDAGRAAQLAALVPHGRTGSGGSVANSCAVAARLGARVAFLGKVADDAMGLAFATDLRDAGVRFDTPPLAGQAPTASCIVLVTPDAQRTMSTHLGACVSFKPADLDHALIASAGVTYLEGYLFDPPEAQAAFMAAAAIARAAGRQVALSLSDTFCVLRHRHAFLDLLRGIDILFANEAEAAALFDTDTAERAAAARVPLTVITRGAGGSVIHQHGETIHVPAEPVQVVDTTGAGDCYAAGFLVALVGGAPLAACGALGSRAAAACIAGYGARPPPPILATLRL